MTHEENEREQTTEFNPYDLFDWGEPKEEKKKQTVVEWREARPGCKQREVTQTVTEIAIDKKNRVYIEYHMMNGDPDERYTYRVYKDTEPFIAEAIESGVLEEGGSYKVTVEQQVYNWNGRRTRDRWIKIDRLF